MSAQIAFTPQRHYKDRMKSMRAETAASWFAVAVSWVVDVFTQPLSPEIDLGPAPRTRDFPSFYC